ncbi:hypothetical protein LCGC14_2595430 [marine sediment metagenome]|uniref:CBS domain-containing protein n=1 Tax=marine sediment metagenome TaxID=412755 RepID=A0A0F9AYA4_9ZZZZ
MSEISNIMSTDMVTIGLRTPITKVIELLLKHNINSVPVFDENMSLLGVVTKKDLLKWTYELMLDHLPISSYLGNDV